MLEENKSVVRRHIREVWNQKNITAIDELFAPDFVNHNPNTPHVKSLQEYKQWVTDLIAIFPDWNVVEEDMCAEGDRVAARWTSSSTVSDQFQHEHLRGRTMLNRAINIHRIVGGKIQELWWGYDQLGINQQMGLT